MSWTSQLVLLQYLKLKISILFVCERAKFALEFMHCMLFCYFCHSVDFASQVFIQSILIHKNRQSHMSGTASQSILLCDGYEYMRQ